MNVPSKSKRTILNYKVWEIINAMCEGLLRQWVTVEVSSYGGYIVDDTGAPVCYGCAATNTLCQLNGKAFDYTNIESRSRRHLELKHLFRTVEQLSNFEEAVDALRRNNAFTFLTSLEFMGVVAYGEGRGIYNHVIESGIKLDYITDTKPIAEQLGGYIRLAAYLKLKNL